MTDSECTFRCLRCGHEYKGTHDPSSGPKELTCPKCRSNSVRRLPQEKTDKKK